MTARAPIPFGGPGSARSRCRLVVLAIVAAALAGGYAFAPGGQAAAGGIYSVRCVKEAFSRDGTPLIPLFTGALSKDGRPVSGVVGPGGRLRGGLYALQSSTSDDGLWVYVWPSTEGARRYFDFMRSAGAKNARIYRNVIVEFSTARETSISKRVMSAVTERCG